MEILTNKMIDELDSEIDKALESRADLLPEGVQKGFICDNKEAIMKIIELIIDLIEKSSFFGKLIGAYLRRWAKKYFKKLCEG